MNEYISSGVVTAIALIFYLVTSNRSEAKPIKIANGDELDITTNPAYELACIKADQYIKANPTAFPNGQYRGYAIFHARRHIVRQILKEGSIAPKQPTKPSKGYL